MMNPGMIFRINKGLEIPVKGAPEQIIDEGRRMETVALLGRDHIGLRPKLLVQKGDKVRIGQPLFVEQRHPDIAYCSPGGGMVEQINYGEKRRLMSVVIALDEKEESEDFPSWSPDSLSGLDRAQVVENLLRTGLWTALRTRPFDKIPDPGALPRSVFVTAIDTHPLAAKPDVVINQSPDDFVNGLEVIAHLTEGPLFVCKAPNSQLPEAKAANIQVVDFWGPHPAGLAGTHIHFLDPVSTTKSVWHLNYQDVIAIGKTFTDGQLSTQRIIALAGPEVTRPRLLKARLGADVQALSNNEVSDSLSHVDQRVISGSLLAGRAIQPDEHHLGRFHSQITVLAEAPPDPLKKSWISKFLTRQGVYSAHGPAKNRVNGYSFTTALNGNPSAMLPFAGYDQMMPLNILVSPLLRALIVGDIDTAQALGCLELGEEDLALLTFMCPAKFDYGPLLQSALTRIEKEG